MEPVARLLSNRSPSAGASFFGRLSPAKKGADRSCHHRAYRHAGAIFGLCDVMAIATPSRQPAGCLAFLPLPHHPNFFKILLISNHYIAIMIFGGKEREQVPSLVPNWYKLSFAPLWPLRTELARKGEFPPSGHPPIAGRGSPSQTHPCPAARTKIHAVASDFQVRCRAFSAAGRSRKKSFLTARSWSKKLFRPV